jgi:Chlorite dismutase
VTVERVTFVAGREGDWRIDRITPIVGAGLPPATHLAHVEGAAHVAGGVWALLGTRSHHRYTHRAEAERLAPIQPPLARPSSTLGALIPIRKSAAWWALAQDERRAIFEDSSHHIALGARYLPAIARRLYHSRELGQPFDFLTWFEFADRDADAFDELAARLRATPEWSYVDREVEIRVERRRVAPIGERDPG